MNSKASPGSFDYEVVRPLGSGGMGVVFECTRSRPGSMVQPVAVKRLSGVWGTEALQAVQREASLMMQVKSAQVVEIFETSIIDGYPSIVMEMVEGCDLQRLLSSSYVKTLQIDVVMHILKSILHALFVSHGVQNTSSGSCGIIHRDIKPANILLSCAGDVKVTDFGVARAINNSTKHLTSAQGTWRYAAPEVFNQKEMKPTVQMDLYSVGAVAFDLLSGIHVGPDIAPGHAIVGEKVPELVRQISFPHGLGSIVMQLLSEDPAARPKSAAQVLKSLSTLSTRMDGKLELSEVVLSLCREFSSPGLAYEPTNKHEPANSADKSSGEQASLQGHLVSPTAPSEPDEIGVADTPVSVKTLKHSVGQASNPDKQTKLQPARHSALFRTRTSRHWITGACALTVLGVAIVLWLKQPQVQVARPLVPAVQPASLVPPTGEAGHLSWSFETRQRLATWSEQLEASLAKDLPVLLDSHAPSDAEWTQGFERTFLVYLTLTSDKGTRTKQDIALIARAYPCEVDQSGDDSSTQVDTCRFQRDQVARVLSSSTALRARDIELVNQVANALIARTNQSTESELRKSLALLETETQEWIVPADVLSTVEDDPSGLFAQSEIPGYFTNLGWNTLLKRIVCDKEQASEPPWMRFISSRSKLPHLKSWVQTYARLYSEQWRQWLLSLSSHPASSKRQALSMLSALGNRRVSTQSKLLYVVESHAQLSTENCEGLDARALRIPSLISASRVLRDTPTSVVLGKKARNAWSKLQDANEATNGAVKASFKNWAQLYVEDNDTDLARAICSSLVAPIRYAWSLAGTPATAKPASPNIKPNQSVGDSTLETAKEPLGPTEEAQRARHANSSKDRDSLYKVLCDEVLSPFRQFENRFPFDRDSNLDADMASFSSYFNRADGSLWKAVEKLSDFVELRGNVWFAADHGRQPGETIHPSMVLFLNKARKVSHAMFSEGSKRPNFELTVRRLAIPGRKDISVSLGSKRLTSTDSMGETISVRWPFSSAKKGLARIGSAPVGKGSAAFALNGGTGPWSLFRLLGQGTTLRGGDSEFEISWGKDKEGQPFVVLALEGVRGVEAFYGPAWSASGLLRHFRLVRPKIPVLGGTRCVFE